MSFTTVKVDYIFDEIYFKALYQFTNAIFNLVLWVSKTGFRILALYCLTKQLMRRF